MVSRRFIILENVVLDDDVIFVKNLKSLYLSSFQINS